MIADLSIGGVLIPGMLAIACLTLVLTAVVLRLLSATGASRQLAFRPLVEVAVFFILLGLLLHGLRPIGPIH